jgi:hypothetical protein
MLDTAVTATLFLASYVIFFDTFRAFFPSPTGLPDSPPATPLGTLLENMSAAASYLACVSAATGGLMRPRGLDCSLVLIVLSGYRRWSVLGLLILMFSNRHPFGLFW